MESAIYHMGMPLQCNGPDGQPMPYSYQQVTDMWEAANATRSNLLMMWFTPDQFYTRFLGTDAEMQRILLAPVTKACVDNRPADECSPNITDRVGPPEGSCDNAPKPLNKVVSGCLYEASSSPDIPEAIRSPAYETLRRYHISVPQLNEIFELWQTEDTPYDAVCEWAANNIGFLNSLYPASYPREPIEETQSVTAHVLTALGIVSATTVVVTSLVVYRKRHCASILTLQPGFLWLVLSGSLLVSIGAILGSAPASNATCLSQTWFINMGYTLALVPQVSARLRQENVQTLSSPNLILVVCIDVVSRSQCVKVSAINRLMEAAAKMKRFGIPKGQLYGTVAVLSVLCAVYLSIWYVQICLTTSPLYHKHTSYQLCSFPAYLTKGVSWTRLGKNGTTLYPNQCLTKAFAVSRPLCIAGVARMFGTIVRSDGMQFCSCARRSWPFRTARRQPECSMSREVWPY